MTTQTVTPTAVQRWRSARWMVLAFVIIAAVATVSAYLTAPRHGGRMDPASTSSGGAHALVTLLRDHGVEAVVADDIAAVEAAARPGTLVLTVQTTHLVR